MRQGRALALLCAALLPAALGFSPQLLVARNAQLQQRQSFFDRRGGKEFKESMNQNQARRWRRTMRSSSMIITHSFSDSMSHLSPVGGSEGDVDPLQPHSGRVLQQAERYSSADWLTHMMTTFQAPTFRRIRSHLFANVLVAVLVFFAYTYMPQHAALFAWSPIPHTTMGGFLGLLLVFRTNSAYDRFWEARKIWGRMLGRVRVLSGVAHRSLHGADREHFLNLVSRMPEILLWHLKGWDEIRARGHAEEMTRLVEMVGKDDGKLMFLSSNRPILLTKMLSAIMLRAFCDVGQLRMRWEKNGKLDPFGIAVMQAELTSQRELVDREIAELSSTVGAAERIVRTTVPSSYSRHTSRFLTVWCFTLPLVLVVPLGWRMVPTITVICWALFTIEEVGHIIEDPFNMPSTNTADSLRLDRSFGGVREDVFERLPATGQGLDVNGGDVYISKDYDVTNFHDRYVARLAVDNA